MRICQKKWFRFKHVYVLKFEKKEKKERKKRKKKKKEKRRKKNLLQNNTPGDPLKVSKKRILNTQCRRDDRNGLSILMLASM